MKSRVFRWPHLTLQFGLIAIVTMVLAGRTLGADSSAGPVVSGSEVRAFEESLKANTPVAPLPPPSVPTPKPATPPTVTVQKKPSIVKRKPSPAPRPKPEPPATLRNPDDPNSYIGDIGGAQIDLTWVAKDGKVVGRFNFVREQAKQYSISGELGSGGRYAQRMNIKFWDGTVQVGSATLKKISGTREGDRKVAWEGDFVTVNGDPKKMLISRPMEGKGGVAGLSPLETVQQFDDFTGKGFNSYAGEVIEASGRVLKAYFKLLIDDKRGAVQGFYYERYPDGETSPVMRLVGQNSKNGVLLLKEYDNDGLSAEFNLKKDQGTKGIVAWRGTLTNVIGNRHEKRVWFSRPK